MTTFVTGATSDLGRVLVRELTHQGHAVRLLIQPESNRAGLELPGVEFVRGSLQDLVVLRKGITGCDRVCHLAAVEPGLPGVNSGDFWRGNRDATANVLQAAHDLRVNSVVMVSDLALLGPTQGDESADEARAAGDTASRPHGSYLQSRHAADALAYEFAARGLPVKLIYPGAGFGCVRPPGQGGLAEAMLLRLAAGKPVAIPGNGQSLVGLSYYRDTAQAIILAHEIGGPGQAYVVVGETLTWMQAWEAVAEVLGKATPQRQIPIWLARLTGGLPPEILHWAGDHWNYSNEKARRELIWQPRPFRMAMAESWDEYQALGVGRSPSGRPGYGRGSQTKPGQAPVRAMRRA